MNTCIPRSLSVKTNKGFLRIFIRRGNERKCFILLLSLRKPMHLKVAPKDLVS